MTEHNPFRSRQGRDQFAFDRDRFEPIGESQPKGEAFDVGIDDDPGGDVERGTDHDVRRFPADPRQLGQGVKIGGNFAAVILDKGLRHAEQILGLGAKEAGRADDRLKFARLNFGKGLGIGTSREKRGSDHIYALIGALRGEDGGDEELERMMKIEAATGVGIKPFQLGDDFLGASFLSGRRLRGLIPLARRLRRLREVRFALVQRSNNGPCRSRLPHYNDSRALANFTITAPPAFENGFDSFAAQPNRRLREVRR